MYYSVSSLAYSLLYNKSFIMNSSKLFYHIRYLVSPTTKYSLQWNSIQSRCLLHTCLPLMNKDMVKIDRVEEQPHMRIEAKAIIEQKRMYKEK